MAIPEHVPLFGFEIFKEIELELEKFKNIYPYSNQNDSNNALIKLCIERIKELAEEKKRDIENKIWD